jgi:RNA polymerase sigma-70 factor (ECF subfamily)
LAEEVIEIEGSHLQELTTSITDPETVLIKKAVSGDTLAFRDLYDSNVSKVYGLCLRMSANIDTAEELTQEVFIKAWRKLADFKSESKFSTWLHRIAVNEFLSRKRTEKRNADKIQRAAEEWKMSMMQYYSFSKEREISMDLEKAIAHLPEQQKAAFLLHDVEGYQHNEIAQMMNISEGTSKSNLHRARKLLRSLLRNENQRKRGEN